MCTFNTNYPFKGLSELCGTCAQNATSKRASYCLNLNGCVTGNTIHMFWIFELYLCV